MKKKLIYLLLVLFSLKGNCQYEFCRYMGDNKIDTWIGSITSGNSKYKDIVAPNNFRFLNISKHRITFLYNNQVIDLQPDAYSSEFTGKIPGFLADCNVKIDNIPISNYYKILDYEAKYQQFSARIIKKFRSDKSKDELASDIADCKKTLIDLEVNKRSVPSWMTQIYIYDEKITQTNAWLKEASGYLEKKKNNSENKQLENSNSKEEKKQSDSDDFWSDKPTTKTSTNSEQQRDQIEDKEEKHRIAQQQAIETVKNNIENRARESKEFESNMVSKATGLVQSFYQGEAARNSYDNINSLSKLNGKYNSIEDLERDFRAQYSQINEETTNFVTAKTASYNSYFNTTSSTTANEATANEAAKLLGGIITDIQANNAKKKAREQLEKQKAIRLKEIETAKINNRIILRTKLVESFPNGGLPLSTHNLNVSEVFLFAYITDEKSFQNEKSEVAISNVFTVTKYSDGTFPYKTTVLNKLKGLGNGDVTIVGYYTDENTAKKMHRTFVEFAVKTNMNVNNFTVKNEETVSAAKNETSQDFWESGNKEQSKKEKEQKKSDFWNE